MSDFTRQLRAKALQKTTETLQEEFCGDNCFNSTSETQMLSQLYKDHKERLEFFTGMIRDQEKKQRYAQSHEERQKAIAEFRQTTREAQQQTTKMKEKQDAFKKMHDEAMVNLQVKKDAEDVKIEQLNQELKKQKAILEEEEKITATLNRELEESYGISKEANDARDFFINLYQTLQPAPRHHCMPPARTIVQKVNMINTNSLKLLPEVLVQKFYQFKQSLQLDGNASTFSQKLQPYIVLLCESQRGKHGEVQLPQIQTSLSVLTPGDRQRLMTAFTNYCCCNWTSKVELQMKIWITQQPIAKELRLRERPKEIQGQCYETDKEDLDVLGVMLAMLAFQNVDIEVKTVEKTDEKNVTKTYTGIILTQPK